jgi:hypothetical protein
MGSTEVVVVKPCTKPEEFSVIVMGDALNDVNGLLPAIDLSSASKDTPLCRRSSFDIRT